MYVNVSSLLALVFKLPPPNGPLGSRNKVGCGDSLSSVDVLIILTSPTELLRT
jgi:hypothetical protein